MSLQYHTLGEVLQTSIYAGGTTLKPLILSNISERKLHHFPVIAVEKGRNLSRTSLSKASFTGNLVSHWLPGLDRTSHSFIPGDAMSISKGSARGRGAFLSAYMNPTRSFIVAEFRVAFYNRRRVNESEI